VFSDLAEKLHLRLDVIGDQRSAKGFVGKIDDVFADLGRGVFFEPEKDEKTGYRFPMLSWFHLAWPWILCFFIVDMTF